MHSLHPDSSPGSRCFDRRQQPSIAETILLQILERPGWDARPGIKPDRQLSTEANPPAQNLISLSL
jgi:hypothetical protein